MPLATIHRAPTDYAIRVRNVSKEYKVWHSPAGRLAGLLGGGLAASALCPTRVGSLLKKKLARLHTDFRALSDLSLEVRPGESVGIVGMNGSGKSTLLQLIAGVLTPTTGTVERHGRVAALLELGSGFNPEFTGRENVYMNAAILGLPRAEIDARFPEIAAFAELGDFLDQPIKSYSNGMVLRLAFAVMTQVDPQILIVDEALAVGDAYFQYKCLAHIRHFRERGGCLLFVSHDAAAVKHLCNRAILLERGRIATEGPPEAVLDYYNALIAQKERDLAIEQVKTEGGRVRTRSGNGMATIEEINILDETGAEKRSFRMGASATVTISVRAHQDIESPTVGMAILDRVGNDVFGTNLSLLSPEPTAWRADERVRVEFDLTLNLGQGTYSLSAAAHSAFTHLESNYDWIDHALIFTVTEETAPRMKGCAALPVKARMRRTQP